MVLMIIGFTFISLAIWSLIGLAWGQDFDQRYACLYKDQHPFNEMCVDQEMDRICETFFNSSAWDIWNALGCYYR